MTIWVDADACPGVIREILYKAAIRTETPLTLIANHSIQVPRSPLIKMKQVSSGFDVADNLIVQQAETGDLVITSDIPLAAELVEKNVKVITPRGERYTAQNIRQRLNIRDFMDTMRSSGQHHGGPAALGQKDKQAFANALDQYLATTR
jgi:uncharacterized protein YaiI (UPF0178 family)